MIVLAIFLIAVLSVGAASAANQTDDSISSAGENIELSDVGDSNLESENMDVLSSSNQTVTPDNFFDYFDDDGYSKTTDDLVFEGEFNSPVSHITISSSRNIYGQNAVFKNMGVKIEANDVTVNGLTLNSNQYVENEEGALIYANGNGIILQNIILNYTPDNGNDVYGIFFDGCDYFKLLDSQINFEAHNLEEFYEYGIKILDCNQSLIEGNLINVSLPLVIVNHQEAGLDQDYPLGIGIGRCEDIMVKDNEIIANVNEIAVDFTTLSAILVADSSDITFNSNNITENDFLTPQGSANCLYAFYLNNNNQVSIEKNNISVKTEGGDNSEGTAYAIQSMISNIDVIGNSITCISNGPNIGVYMASLQGESAVGYIANNMINVTGLASSEYFWALVSGVEVQNGEVKVYNNSIYTHNVGDYDDKVYCYGISYSQWMYGERSFDIQDNTVVTNGKYTISTIATREGETTPVRIKNNNLTAHDLVGDDSIQLCGENSTIPDDNGTDNGTDDNVTSNMTIDVNNVWIDNDNIVTVTIPNATGSVTISINGKTYTVELENYIATKTLPADDLIVGENTLTVTYNDLQNSTTFKVLNGIVTSENVLDYFNQKNSGALNDCVPEGVTLDFQGEIMASDVGAFNITINKAVNIISSTQDAYLDLNTTAGSYEASNPGDRFTINKQGSGTNVTGIKFHNTQLWLSNTDHVTLDNINVTVLNQRVGSGVGVTSIRDNSTYITVKNSYFSTYNNGGSSTLVLGWANYCNVINNTICGEGNVGNLFYLNTYNVVIPSGALVNSYNNIINNTIYGPTVSSAICRAICYMGTCNLIENNTIYSKGEGFTPSDNSAGMSNIILSNNRLYNGSSMTIVGGVDAHDNYVTGKITLSNNAYVSDSIAGALQIRGDNTTALNITINGDVTIDAVETAQIRNSNITGDISIARNAENIIISENRIIGTITIKGANNAITNNFITSSGTYAVVMIDSRAKGNNVTLNHIYAREKFGNEAVNTNSYNLVRGNLPETTELTVEVNDIKVGQTATVRIWLNANATGSVKVKFNSVETPITMKNGYGTFDIADLTAGAYTVQVIFSGDDIYGAKSETKTFAVSKYDIPLEVEVNVPDRGNPTFSLDLGSDVTGSITVRINNNNYTETLVNGRATVTVTDLEAGSYSATVTYSGDNKYNSNSTACDFIIKAEPSISIAVDDINVGQTAYINVSADSRISSVSVVLNGEYSLDLNNGEGSLPVSGLGYGNYTVYVVFNGNSELLDKTVNRTFSVSKVDVSQDSIAMDNDFKAPEFAITLNDDATGDLTVTINANNYSQTISGGKATVVVEGLAPNDYEATVRYSGDSKYNPVSKVFNFVIKAEPTINIEVKDILVGDVAAINITTDDGIDTVKVILNGVRSVEIINGKGNVSIHDLSAGKYTVKVIFEGNDNFFAKEVTANITVSKHQLPEDVFVQEGNNFTVNLPADATGTFTVEIGENISSSPVNGGTANVIVNDLNPGDYDVLMSYSGDEKYANVSKITTLNVPKWQSAIEANVSNIKVGEDAVFDIEVTEGATGNVSVIIEGKRHNGTLINGKAQISVPNLSNGTYEASVNYYGDNNYLPSNIPKTFTVSKVDIEGSWYSIGQSIVINLPSDATGNVTVNVNNNGIVEDVIGGTATITPELTPGTYPVSIAYSGDGKYNGIGDISQIIVPKYDTPISASANEIIVGETLIVTITVPNTATGNVSVVIKGNSYNGTVNAGKAIVKVDNLPVGNYTAEINYVGDNNYSANKTSLEFKIDEKITPNPDNAFVIPDTGSANPTYSINLENATGNFTVYVDGKEYQTVALVDGKATINVTDLPSGSHNITVAYSGDGRFAPISKNVTVNVPEPHVPVVKLVGSDVTMLYTSGSVYKIRLTSDDIALSGKTVVFTVNGKKISAVTDKNGYASVKIDLPPKSAKYALTATYNGVKTSNTVKVNGIVTAKNVKVKKSKKVNKIKVTLKKVNGKYLKSKKLTLKINGKKVTAKTNKKGVATFKVKKNVLKKLKAGKKYKYTVTYLKEKVTKKITVKK